MGRGAGGRRPRFYDRPVAAPRAWAADRADSAVAMPEALMRAINDSRQGANAGDAHEPQPKMPLRIHGALSFRSRGLGAGGGTLTPSSVRTGARMTLSPEQSQTLARQLAIATLAGLNLRQAVRLLLEVVPDYPRRVGQGASLGREGVRWFDGRMDAVADGIWRASFDPELIPLSWRSVVPAPVRRSDGLWGIVPHGIDVAAPPTAEGDDRREHAPRAR